MIITELIGTAVVGVLIGYLTFAIILRALPARLRSGNLLQKREVLRDARAQAEVLNSDTRERAKANIIQLTEELEESIKERGEDLKIAEADLESREQSITAEENRVKKAERDLESHVTKAAELLKQVREKEAEIAAMNLTLQGKLEDISSSSAAEIKANIVDRIVESRRLECQKVIRIHQDELQTSAKRLAYRTMSRALARYAPEFPWPKAINHVEIPDQNTLDLLNAGEQAFLKDMREKGGIDVEIMISEKSHIPPVIKLSGGAGVDREAVRLAMSELIAKGHNSWSGAAGAYDKHRAVLEQQAVKLGRRAVAILGLSNIHPEVQKLVGYLNWRTSYRQNQYLHSLEVAVLAGIVASELEVDINEAKRCGLLHDIGKAIDYRIEGSHAVISADYADRFGERRMICDTVMSHHNDLVIETPLAYVLKTADTLSGARPGARVNLEEGYQIRLSAIDDVVRSFPGIVKSAIMNGGREVHIEVNHKRIQEEDLQSLSSAIAKKIEQDVAFPGQIKVLVSRRFEAVSVA